jgi:hypothetical protein
VAKKIKEFKEALNKITDLVLKYRPKKRKKAKKDDNRESKI